LLHAIRAEHPRINVFMLSDAAQTDTTTGLQGVVPLAPWHSTWMARRLLGRLRVQVLIVAGEPAIPTSTLATVVGEGVKLVVIGRPSQQLAGFAKDVALCAVAADAAVNAEHLGVRPDALATDLDSHALFARMTPLLITERAPAKASRPVERFVLANLHRPPFAWLVRDKYEVLTTLAELDERLGHPSTIMCLGNGPSSEDPDLDALPFDALFRVNHTWLTRARHTDPDVIFTGLKDTVKAYPRATLFGFQTEDAARRVTLRALLLRRPMPYFTAERLGVVDFHFFEPYKPTNGAVMIATAVALRPERIIVAGVDLFSDPRGAYPGAGQDGGGYTIAHNRALEARFILETLAAFDGDVIVVGDVLKERWRSLRATPASERQMPS